MFEVLTEKLNGVFQRLGNKGTLTERDVDAALREVRLALLEADVNFRVARDLVGRIRARALEEEVLTSLSPGQQVVKITNEELTATLDGGSHRLETSSRRPSVAMMVGLNGSGKTTTAAKLARHLSQQGQQSLLVAADLQRPAAPEQLETLGKQVGVEVYRAAGASETPDVARDGVRRAEERNAAWAIVDTAGRFQVDEDLMAELERVKAAVSPVETLLVVDAMAGQDAVNAAQEFPRPRRYHRSRAHQDGRRCQGRRGAVHHRRHRRAHQVHRQPASASTPWKPTTLTGWPPESWVWVTCSPSLTRRRKPSAKSRRWRWSARSARPRSTWRTS